MERVSSRRACGTCVVVFGYRALLGLALLALVACGEQLATTPSPGPVGGSRVPATSTPAIAFPQLAPVASPRTMMAALLEGSLVLVDGCLRVTSFGSSNLIIWPPEVAVRTDGGEARVVAAAGRVVARVGEDVRLSGGQLTSVGPGLREAPPARCPGPYWLTGEILGPKPAPTATLTRPPGVAFPQLAQESSQLAQETGRGGRAARLAGPLALVDDCLRVAGGSTSYLVVWPADVALSADGGRVQVVFPGGRVVARVGEWVTLLGLEVHTSEQVADALDRPLHEAPPARCPGPYWVTGRVLPPTPAAAPTVATP